MTSVLFRRSLLCLLTALVAACGDSPSEPDGELSEAEFEALVEVMAVLSDIGLSAALGSPPGPSGVPETFPLENTTVSCPVGGTVLVGGTITVDEEAEEFEMDVTLTHQSCTARAETSNRQFTLNGNPNVAYDLFFGFVSEDEFVIEIDQVGGIRWSTGGRSGDCSIDLHVEITGTVSQQSGTGFLTGTMCGQSVQEDVVF